MARSKFINTFDTTAEYETYIESAYPEFPNVGYDKQLDKVNIVRTSPNNHLFYAELVDVTQNIPEIQLDYVANTPTVDALTNMCYLDSWSTTTPYYFYIDNKDNLKSIKKWRLDTSSVTNMGEMFYGCTALTSIDLSGWDTSNVTDMPNMFFNCTALTTLDLSSFDTSNVTDMSVMFMNCESLTSLDLSGWDTSSVTYMDNMFYGCSALTDVYITEEATLMKLTNNLTSEEYAYIPSNSGNCTIHFNGTDYKWQNNRWRPQS